MSIIPLPEWSKRKRYKAGEVIPVESDWRGRITLPPDLEQDLARALDEPFGAPPRTAQTVANELAHLRDELANARELVKAGEAKEAALQLELKVKIDEEIAAKKATHDAEVAALEDLRPATGGSGEGDQTQPL